MSFRNRSVAGPTQAWPMAGCDGGATLLHDAAVNAAIGSHKSVREDMRKMLPGPREVLNFQRTLANAGAFSEWDAVPAGSRDQAARVCPSVSRTFFSSCSIVNGLISSE